MTLIYYPTWARLDGLLAGVGAAAIQTFRPAWWRALTARANILGIAGVAGVVISAIFFQHMIARFLPAVFGFPLLASSMALLVVAGSTNRSFIGRYSIRGAGALAAGAYSLYLSQKMVFQAVESSAPWWPRPFQTVSLEVALLVALGAGALLYWLVERPFLKLRDRLQGLKQRCFDSGADSFDIPGDRVEQASHLCADRGIGRLQPRFRTRSRASADAGEREHGEEKADRTPGTGHRSSATSIPQHFRMAASVISATCNTLYFAPGGCALLKRANPPFQMREI